MLTTAHDTIWINRIRPSMAVQSDECGKNEGPLETC
jgi:hypothetical protein